LTPENAAVVWNQALARMSGMVAEQAKQYDRVELCGPNRLVISIKREYAFAKVVCQRPEQVSRFEAALAEVTGQPVRVEFTVDESRSGESNTPRQQARRASLHERRMEVLKHPMIQRVGELFGSMQIDVSDPPQPE
jgi:hypothetical protein